MDALKEFEKYCKYEVDCYKRIANDNSGYLSKADIERAKNYTFQRMLGASFYAQYLGCEFEDVDRIYESYKNTITKE